MSCYLSNFSIQKIADAIREINGKTESYKLSDMPSAIANLDYDSYYEKNSGSCTFNFSENTIDSYFFIKNDNETLCVFDSEGLTQADIINQDVSKIVEVLKKAKKTDPYYYTDSADGKTVTITINEKEYTLYYYTELNDKINIEILKENELLSADESLSTYYVAGTGDVVSLILEDLNISQKCYLPEIDLNNYEFVNKENNNLYYYYDLHSSSGFYPREDLTFYLSNNYMGIAETVIFTDCIEGTFIRTYTEYDEEADGPWYETSAQYAFNNDFKKIIGVTVEVEDADDDYFICGADFQKPNPFYDDRNVVWDLKNNILFINIYGYEKASYVNILSVQVTYYVPSKNFSKKYPTKSIDLEDFVIYDMTKIGKRKDRGEYYLTKIANAIRTIRNEPSRTYYPSNMGNAILYRRPEAATFCDVTFILPEDYAKQLCNGSNENTSNTFTMKVEEGKKINFNSSMILDSNGLQLWYQKGSATPLYETDVEIVGDTTFMFTTQETANSYVKTAALWNLEKYSAETFDTLEEFDFYK